MSAQRASAAHALGEVSSAMRAPRAARFGEWSRERFPLAYGVLCAALFGAAVLHARAQATAGAVELSGVDALGFLAAWSYFLLLRVLDEHKDFESDRVLHPGRPVQRGVVSLMELRVLGGLAVVLQLAAVLGYEWTAAIELRTGSAADVGGVGAVAVRWGLLMAWTFLMAKEFFAPRWLRDRLLLYAVSHMLSMPLVILWLAQMGAGAGALRLEVYALAASAFLLGFVFEIARKTFAPSDERPGVASYSAMLGTGVAPVVMLALLVDAIVLIAVLIASAASGWVALGALAMLALALGNAAWATIAFVTDPTRAAAKALEQSAGVATLLAYLALGLAIVVTRGIA